MKKLFATLLLLSATLLSKANHSFSALRITSTDGAYFIVAVSGPQFSAAATSMVIDNLAPGNHYLKIKRWSAQGYHAGYKTVFAGYVFVPELSVVNAVVTRHQFKVTQVSPLPACQPVVYEPDDLYPHTSAYLPVSSYDFDPMIASIENRTFESTRMQLAKQLIDQNFFTSRQVMRLLNTMTFESSKLELAKYAYHKTVDRNNYYIVNDAFTFESSITDLSRFITSQG